MTKYIIAMTTPTGIKYPTISKIVTQEKEDARRFSSKSEAKRYITKNKRNITASNYEVIEID